MGMNQSFYIGPYLKILDKKIKYIDKYKTCINEVCFNLGKKLSSMFCDRCGSVIKEMPFEKERPLNMYDLMVRYFNNGDIFRDIRLENIESNDFVLLIPNKKEQGGITLDECTYGEESLPDIEMNIFDSGDWNKMIKVLQEEGIKFEKKVGIVSYVS